MIKNQQSVQNVMDVRDLYNNPEDSDIKIRLRTNSVIHAHKIILKRGSNIFKKMLENKLRENTEGIITFPEHSDSVVKHLVSFIYGVETNFLSLQCDEWCELVKFAHYIDAINLLSHLVENIHSNATFGQLIKVAFELDHPELLTKTIRLFVKTYTEDTESASKEFVNAMRELDWSTYMQLHQHWLVEKFDAFILFTLDCKFCEMISQEETNDASDILAQLIPFIDFTQFDTMQLLACINTPLIAANSAYTHMLTCMMKLVTNMPAWKQPRMLRKAPSSRGRPRGKKPPPTA